MIIDKKGLFLLTAALTLSAAAFGLTGGGHNKALTEARAEAVSISDYPLATHTWRMVYDVADLDYGDHLIFAMKGADNVWRALDDRAEHQSFPDSNSFTVELDYANKVFAVDEFVSGANPGIFTLEHADESKPGIKFGTYGYSFYPNGSSQPRFLYCTGRGWPSNIENTNHPYALRIDGSTGAVTTRMYKAVGTTGNTYIYKGGDLRAVCEKDGIYYLYCGDRGYIDESGTYHPDVLQPAPVYDPELPIYIFKIEKGIVSQPKIPHVTFTPSLDSSGTDINVYDDPERAHSTIDGWNGTFYIQGDDSSIVNGERFRCTFSLDEPFTIIGLSFSGKVGTGASNTEWCNLSSPNGYRGYEQHGNYADIFVVGPAASDGYSNFVLPLPRPISEPGSEDIAFYIYPMDGELFVKSFTIYYTTAYSEFSNSVGVTSNLGFSYDMDGETVTNISKVSLKFKCSIPNGALANISNPTGFGATVRAEGSENTMNFEAGTDKISENADGKFFTFAINNVPRTAFKTELTITPYINADIGGKTKTIYLPEKTMSVKRLIEAYQGEAASALSELQAFLIEQFATYFAADLAD